MAILKFQPDHTPNPDLNNYSRIQNSLDNRTFDILNTKSQTNQTNKLTGYLVRFIISKNPRNF